MFNSSTTSSLNNGVSVTYIYLGPPILFVGVLGEILNIIVFLSLRIYRQSSSTFYLTIGSIFNIGQLLTGLLSSVFMNGVMVSFGESSLFYCKLRAYIFQSCGVISPACLCLATIDQFLATSTRPEWQQWSNVKTAHRSLAICIIGWLLYGIVHLIYYNLYVSSAGKVTCIITNITFDKYFNTFHVLVIMEILPLSVTTVFGLMAYYNVGRLSHRALPIVRRRHEVQLTVMVLVQILFSLFAYTPSIILRIIILIPNLTNNPVTAAQIRFACALVNCIYYLYYAIPFYIYICVSKRFRKQLRYVLVDIHLNRWRRVIRNEVLPQLHLAPTNVIRPLTIENIELV